MGVKQKRPLTPGQRFQVSDDYSDLTKFEPEKSLLSRLPRTAGRDCRGRVSARHRGGGNLRLYRQIDFKRDKDMVARVLGIEYDPNRNARIALLEYEDGERRYILAPIGLNDGDKVTSGVEVDIKPGNALPLSSIPVGTTIHNIELEPGRGGKMARSAGAGVMLLAKEKGYAIIKMTSGEQRMVHLSCRATVGQVGNLDAKNVFLGKAGKRRHLGWRPQVRGVAMNPCDHPHGGGEGKAPIGRKQPVTPWGKPTLGKKTRKPRRRSERFILKRRK
ncbi:50S ribosomal protein L2 [Candidatus Saganbacteria bacterium CG08_land_8_20_14_0_20_45_16]|uniref:Large ribosomal subunit protein uL2 n=1 Tax=Candidatus Saganbacteria bacterium CG08_land_8_20_14_0_20_45_16 TaxID=2014293 RepID=A0A2H0XXE6_UNCSA|nr:MAG: 50S ribosomal protein L2 [Candidatus Saganbacteria bacterium CG08_land_8_20_14_0_20_45_16]